MTVNPHQLILASAGTGKTWQLTGRFIALLLEGVAPERILATTFTRKAAGEILDRVLRRLMDAVEDPEKRDELSDSVGRRLTAEELRAQLAAVTRRLDRFQIRTLDAFFVRLAHLFALDLGLPPDWTIVEEAEDMALRRDAVARALAVADRGAFLELLRGLQQADASRSIERALLEKVEDGRDAFLDSRAEAWEVIVAPPPPPKAELDAARDALGAMPTPATKAGTPRKHWQSNLDAVRRCADEKDWEGLFGVTLVTRILSGDATFDRADIEEAHRAAILPLTRKAASVLIGQVARENHAAHAWLERFEAAYEELKGEERAYRFEDLPKALHPRDENRIGTEDLIWYRLDGRIDHLLLDEFQDTAPVQWRILANLANEILADGTGARSFFCVGDGKQSIYGWREAEPRLLAELDARYPVLSPTRLSKNYRSSRVVLDTVRTVFEDIGANPAFGDRPERVAAACGFQEDFDEPRAADELPGAAWLLQAREGVDGEPSPALALAARRARAILDEAPLATVGLLLRRNHHIPQLIYLLREVGIRASGEGGNPLTDSAAVLHLLSLLHLADHPGDSAAAFHVASSPLGAAAGLSADGYRQERSAVAARVRARLGSEGYGAFCSSFLDVVRASYGSWDRKRFDQLVDLAHAFEDRAGLRADLFVDHARATPVEDPSANQVKVMTIHAAKGLEFDAVVLPELDAALSLRDSALLTRRRDPAGLLDAVSHSRGREVCALDEGPNGLQALWSDVKERETREALCLLYVAMTRARHRLDLIVEHRKTYKPRGTHAGILWSALAPGRPADADGVVWRHPESTEPWYPEKLASRPAPPPAEERAHPRFRVEEAPRVLPTRTPSSEEGDGRREPRELLRSPRSKALVHGLLLHRWLEEVEWIEDFSADDGELLAIGRRMVAEDEVCRGALSELRACLTRPALRAELARPEGDVEVWRERRFAVVLSADGEGGGDGQELWSGSFDRVVLHLRDGAPVRAVLVDFKSDRASGPELDARVDFYRPQLLGYRRVLAHMTGLDEGAIDARLVFLHADEVRPV